MNKLIKASRIGYTIISLSLCIMGILFIFFSETFLNIIPIVLGLIFILFGIVRIVGYFSKDLFQLLFQYDLAVGVMMILIGVLFLTTGKNMLSLICVYAGIYSLIDGSLRIQMAFDAKDFGIEKWWIIIVLAVLTCLIGILLIFRPTSSLTIFIHIIGAFMLCEGILNFVSTIMVAERKEK